TSVPPLIPSDLLSSIFLLDAPAPPEIYPLSLHDALPICCVMQESKPLPKLNPIQADRQIPQDELLDVVVHPLDPGIPPNLDAKEIGRAHVSPDIRKAESRYIATLLRATLESSGQWGAVRVAPESAQFIDVIVSGRILESTGAKLALEITAKDSTGRVWIDARRYQSPPDTAS